MGLCKLIVIVGVAAMWMQPSNSASIGGQDNMCICTREYFPVCGSDGVTYSNKCVFACEKRTLKDLEIKFYGECEDQAAADEVLCMCTREYEPVCGTDGKTYSNKCTFKCAQKNNQALEFSSYGQCVEISNLPMDQEIPEIKNLPMDGEIPEVQQYEVPCLCTREYNPVCGNDGNTYSNKCMLNCAKNTNTALEMFASGECADQAAADEILCMCTREYQPVCGSDGKTYSNKCTFKCAQKNNQALEFSSFGQCVEKAVAEEVMCMCSYEYAPVCGTDGKTYANKCSLNCAQKTNKQLELSSFGECVDQPAADEILCMCTREYQPVCGNDGKTYSNKCTFKCAQKNNKALEFSSFGQCVEKAAAEEVMCMCTYEYAPVCGTDSKTYANKCSLNCAQKTNKQLDIFAVGTCDQVRNFPVENEKNQVQTLPLIEEMCICTREYQPVCGSDGHTYSNKCMMNCEQHMKSDLKLEHYGEC